ncbi:MAG TPA: enoyl-CoA hydratase/isomerase family protein [Candidatus Limnocylindria bacterium]|nr:enoyl-CoA hydratase/isomerase family protein [Candidatus Limnocylindria bacterium]
MIEIRLDGPGKNALGTGVMEHTRERLRDAAGRPVLLTGAGDAFSAGLDLKEVVSLDAEGMARYLQLLEDFVATLFAYPGPTVAAVNGHAIAGGCVLALCCDHRVIAGESRLRIGLNEVALGVPFPPRTLAAVVHRLPPCSRDAVLLGAELHGPDAALRLGLVDEIAADPVARARERLALLASRPAGAYAATKLALRAALVEPSDAASRQLLDDIVPAWCAPAVRERLATALRPRR